MPRRAQHWLQPLIDKHNDSVMRKNKAGRLYAIPVMAALSCFFIDPGVSGGLALCLLIPTMIVDSVVESRGSFLTLDGKPCYKRVQMPTERTIQNIVTKRPASLEYALMQHVIRQAEIMVTKLPEE